MCATACTKFIIGDKTDGPNIEAELPTAESRVGFLVRGQQAPSSSAREEES